MEEDVIGMGLADEETSRRQSPPARLSPNKGVVQGTPDGSRSKNTEILIPVNIVRNAGKEPRSRVSRGKGVIV